MIEVSQRSWHYRWQHLFFRSKPETLCDYMWRQLFVPLMLLGMGLGALAALLLLAVIGYIAFHDFSWMGLWSVVWRALLTLAGTGVLALVVAWLVDHWPRKIKLPGLDAEGIVDAFFAAKKEKYCPKMKIVP